MWSERCIFESKISFMCDVRFRQNMRQKGVGVSIGGRCVTHHIDVSCGPHLKLSAATIVHTLVPVSINTAL